MVKKSIKKICRKIRKKIIPYTWWKKRIKNIDKMVFYVWLLWPAVAVPQLVKIWILQDATWLSIITWFLWIVVAIFWVIYWINHKLFPVIISNTIYIIIETGVVLGILLYW